MFLIRTLLQNLFMLFIKVYADEQIVEGEDTTQEPTEPQKPQNVSINFEQLIAKARQEEKEKLYPQIEKLKTENATMTQKINDYILKLAEKDEKISSLKKELERVSANPNITKEYEKLKEEVEKLRAENENLKQEYESKISSIELDYYKKEKIAEANGKLIPELVTGTTKEEIDASIELARKRYEEIISSAVSQPTVSTTTIPPANPKNTTTQTIFGNLSPEDVLRMSPKEWAEARKRLGL